MERSGRAGKEVTVVEQLGLSKDDLLQWLRDLKRQLGCGGSLDGGALVLQGDQRQRLCAILAERGVKVI